jgi:hypothetical protein
LDELEAAKCDGKKTEEKCTDTLQRIKAEAAFYQSSLKERAVRNATYGIDIVLPSDKLIDPLLARIHNKTAFIVAGALERRNIPRVMK